MNHETLAYIRQARDEVGAMVSSDPDAVIDALCALWMLGGFDGGHHKAYAIDVAVRALTGERYSDFVAAFSRGDDGPDTYEWDTGIAP